MGGRKAERPARGSSTEGFDELGKLRCVQTAEAGGEGWEGDPQVGTGNSHDGATLGVLNGEFDFREISPGLEGEMRS